MLRLLMSTENGNERDYSRYVDWATLQIVSQLSVPTQMTLTFWQFDQLMIPPFERCRVRLVSEKSNRTIFTGYVAATPDQNFVAFNPQQQFFKYVTTVTSDEYLLNFKPVDYIPAYINQTQGQILASLAEIMMPGFFDTSLIQPGFLVPYYVYDPTQTWSQIAKTFADAARYYYYCKDKKIIYAPYGDDTLGVSYDEVNQPRTRWNSQKLATTVLQVPTVNDCTMIGDVEAGSSHDDYYVGDGFTGEYILNYATYQSRTALLLQDDFTGQTLNTQNWTLNDPQNNLNFSVGALNVVSPITGAVLTGQLIANNGLELAGSIEMQHGEIQFNNASLGEVGGLYFDASLLNQFCAFDISTPSVSGFTTTESVSGAIYGEEHELHEVGGFFGAPITGVYLGPTPLTLTASGAGGIYIQPSLSGQLLGPQIITQPNHHYVLNTRISAPAETRFQQVFATKDGTYFAGQQSALYGNVTYSIEDVDIGATYNQSLTGIFNNPISTTTVFTASGVLMPAYAAYGLIRNGKLNLTLSYCLLSKTPAGTLSIAGSTSGAFLPTGAILPFLGPEAEYFGPVSPLLTGQLVLSSGVTGALAAPTPLLAPNLHTLGFGLDQQDASIVQSGANNNQDTLGFYLTTTPAAGSRVKFSSNEAQRAISRVVDMMDVDFEAALVGDDGHRSAVVSNLNPLPRTSEDCDAAAQAYIYDREQIFYNGTYTAESDLLEQVDTNYPYYPIPGRFLNVNCPPRNILATDFLVTKVTTNILEPVTEILSWLFTFGADTRTEKLIAQFVVQQTPNIFTPQDAANVPTPQSLTAIVTGTYLPDLTDISLTACVDGLAYFGATSPYITPPGTPGGPISAPALSGGVAPPAPSPLPGPVQILPASGKPGTGSILNPWSPPISAYNLGPILAGRPISGPIDPAWSPVASSTASGAPAVQRLGPAQVLPPTFSIPPVSGNTLIEVRLSDFSWGQNTANLIGRYATSSFVLNKNNIDQTWYMRFVQFGADGAPTMISRRSKVIRVFYPFRPEPPNIIFATTVDIQLDFAGDQRNIYGIELRAADDTTVMFQQSANDTTDLYFNLQKLLNITASSALINSNTVDTTVTQNVTIPATAAPWNVGVNPSYVYDDAGTSGPVQCPVTGGINYDFTAVGVVKLSAGGASMTPAGSSDTSDTDSLGNYRPGTYCGGAAVGAGALIGAWSDSTGVMIGEPFLIGSNTSVTAPSSATVLLLGINDSTNYADNTGYFSLTLANLVVSTVQVTSPAVTSGLTSLLTRGYNARFFNSQWLYSPVRAIYIPPPPAPELSIGVRFAQMLQINSDILTDRDDIISQQLEVSDDNFNSVNQSLAAQGQPGGWSFSVASTGCLWVRSFRNDLISSGAMSPSLYVPQGDLIASDYLASQGSVPPVVTDNAGGLFAYTSTTGTVTIVSQPIGMVFPNKQIVELPSVTGTFSTAISGSLGAIPLSAASSYGFFPMVDNPTSPNADVSLGSLYELIPDGFVQTLIQDGRTLLSTSALTVTTASLTGGGYVGGGSGGGTGAPPGQPGGCTELAEPIQLADGSLKLGNALIVGHLLRGPRADRPGKIKSLHVVHNVQLYRVTTETGRTIRCSESHAFKINRRWASCGEMIERLAEGEPLTATTEHGNELVTEIALAGSGSIVALKLATGQHVYYAAGFESHNQLYKPGAP